MKAFSHGKRRGKMKAIKSVPNNCSNQQQRKSETIKLTTQFCVDFKKKAKNLFVKTVAFSFDRIFFLLCKIHALSSP